MFHGLYVINREPEALLPEIARECSNYQTVALILYVSKVKAQDFVIQTSTIHGMDTAMHTGVEEIKTGIKIAGRSIY